MQIIESQGARTAFLVLMLATLLAGDAWRYTIGWTGFVILGAALALISVVILVVRRGSWKISALPYPLILFLALTVISLAWSFYPGATALGILATWCTVIGGIAVAVIFSWDEILRGLGLALRAVLGLSLVFEFTVSAIIRAPVLPPVPEPGIDYSNLPDPIPPMLFWSRNELFQGEKIQGIVGNSTLLSFVALLGMIVFAIQWASGSVRGTRSLFWIAVAVASLALSRSATNVIGLAVVAAVAASILLIRRAHERGNALRTYAALGALAIAGVVGTVIFWTQALGLFGKSSDLTNRTQIWTDVIALAQQRPVIGWGWVSYWAPWAKPFDTLAENNGVRQLHAHNAWIDVWFQLGIVGLIVFGLLVLSTLVRSWAFAVDRSEPWTAISGAQAGAHAAVTMLPVLLVAALLVQSAAESRLLVEFGLFALAVIAVKTKNPQWAHR